LYCKAKLKEEIERKKNTLWRAHHHTQRGHRDLQKPSGHGFGQLAVGGPAQAGG